MPDAPNKVVELGQIPFALLQGRLQELRKYLQFEQLLVRQQQLETQMAQAGFWDNAEEAQKISAEVSRIKTVVAPLHELASRVEDLEVLMELAREESDSDLVQEAAQEAETIAKEMDRIEVLTLLSGEHDDVPAYVTIHAGAGGTESCDWADMLARMYQRWMERKGLEVAVMDVAEGEEAGIRSITLHVKGSYAYGMLNCERGVHRLVRISPFDSQSRRHTSFASVDVNPEIESAEIEVNESDVKVDTFRSGGKGGQNVNKVETAVRMTHVPSGVVVACQRERSQGRNRELAMQMLKAKLFQIEEDKKRAASDALYGEKGEIAWGSQIRSYVFQPYQMVKDHRTDYEMGNVTQVMDGELDGFIEARLRQNAGSS